MLRTSFWCITSSSLYTSELLRMSFEQLLSETNRSSPQQQAWGLVWQPLLLASLHFSHAPYLTMSKLGIGFHPTSHFSSAREDRIWGVLSGESRAGTEKRTKNCVSFYPHFIRNTISTHSSSVPFVPSPNAVWHGNRSQERVIHSPSYMLMRSDP